MNDVAVVYDVARGPLDVCVDGYRTHPLHAKSRIWTETNCYVDLWVEVLHSMNLEPLAACGFALSAGFDGDQWEFVKFFPEDLRSIYGIDVGEMNIWRPLHQHVLEKLAAGQLLTVEVDSFYLPDTAGVSYHNYHEKTTIVPAVLDVKGGRMEYFHNSGFFEVSGSDFTNVLRLDPDSKQDLPPYVEVIRSDRLARVPDAELRRRSRRSLQQHLSRRPVRNPVWALGERITADLPVLAKAGLEYFHGYAFGTCRQLGATAEIAASYLSWLGGEDLDAIGRLAEDYMRIATEARSLEFVLARAARGREVDVKTAISRIADIYESADETIRLLKVSGSFDE